MRPALEFPFAARPEPGTTLEVAPGVHWVRMPLPFELDHINLWLLEERDGWAIVDTGIGNPSTRAHWERLLEARLGGRALRRVFVTHYHPDHAGNAAWLCERFGAELWMTRAEYLTAHAVLGFSAGYSPQAAVALFRANGLDEARCAGLLARGDLYRRLVPDFPRSHRRLYEGDRVAIGAADWRVLVGYGHCPEHASLYCEAQRILISGDMLLPRISTNVGVRPIDPGGDPLRVFLASIRRFRELPEDVLVLPSHGEPFRGAHERVAALEAHHQARLADLEQACARAPHSAAEALEVLFRRKLDSNQIYFAMGEAIAHLHALYYSGRARREVGADGVARYGAPAPRQRAAA
jgi:glyoxylase-like metal-dependent hydrolase (beta-lactamase superfamily II)